VFKNLILQKLDLANVQTLVNWAQAEGWNPGPHDAHAYFAADSNGFYGYFHESELIAGGSIVSYQGNFGFMGFFIVKPDYRGKGIGNKLWYERRNKLTKRLKPNAPIGMDGVVDMQPFYQKGGFEIAFRDIRYACQGTQHKIDQHISPVSVADISLIREMDTLCFGFDRWNFLKPWLQLPDLFRVKMIINKRISGFAFMRKAHEGFKICPLFAEDQYVADELFKACLNHAEGEMVYLDVPESNSYAVDLAQKHSGQSMFECARMYYGGTPNIPIKKVFGITTFELG
jgi:GNAT superfamily N-acetyltransferase